MSISNHPIGISINFDTFNEAFGFPKDFIDPCFNIGIDRITELADKYRLKLTFFIIGKDLENEEHYNSIKKLSQKGFEIGNHTWSHPVNLSALSIEEIKNEILLAHKLITDCCQKSPKGFIAPAWSISPKVINSLIELNYEYDTSLYSSYTLILLLLKMAINHIRKPFEAIRVFHRADYNIILRKNSIQPGLINKEFKQCFQQSEKAIVELPLPCLNKYSFPLWHTIGFQFGWDFLYKRLHLMLNHIQCFYYLLHPADFMESADLPKKYRHSLERMNVPLKDKLNSIENVFKIIASSGRPSVFMRDLSNYFLDKASLGK